MNMPSLDTLLLLAGLGHLGVILAASLVPFSLDWKTELKDIPKLHRQMYITYGGYIVLSMVFFLVLNLGFRQHLITGSVLARVMLGFMAVFWGIRLCLQPVFDVSRHLDRPWKRAGYHALTVLFLYFTLAFGAGALGLIS